MAQLRYAVFPVPYNCSGQPYDETCDDGPDQDHKLHANPSRGRRSASGEDDHNNEQDEEDDTNIDLGNKTVDGVFHFNFSSRQDGVG